MSGIYVYLDVDGVLNTATQKESRQLLPSDLLANLRRVLEGVPGCRIVVSSSWRRMALTMRLLTTQLVAAGIPEPVGVTSTPAERVPLGATLRQVRLLEEQRAEEILEHVAEHRPRAWVALDDLDLLCKVDGLYFVLTKDDAGLTEERADLAARCLRDQLGGATEPPPASTKALPTGPVAAHEKNDQAPKQTKKGGRPQLARS